MKKRVKSTEPHTWWVRPDEKDGWIIFEKTRLAIISQYMARGPEPKAWLTRTQATILRDQLITENARGTHSIARSFEFLVKTNIISPGEASIIRDLLRWGPKTTTEEWNRPLRQPADIHHLSKSQDERVLAAGVARIMLVDNQDTRNMPPAAAEYERRNGKTIGALAAADRLNARWYHPDEPDPGPPEDDRSFGVPDVFVPFTVKPE